MKHDTIELSRSTRLLALLSWRFCIISSLLVCSCHASPAGSQRLSPRNSSYNAESRMTPAAPHLDVCRLLENSEIQSIQGAEVQQAEPTTQKYGRLEIAQCYYTAHSSDGTENLSVYLQVIQRDPKDASAEAVREFWKGRFAERKEEERKAGREERDEPADREKEEEGEAIGEPVAVSGIGDEAFWLASDRGGALYVLKQERVLRITVGGADAKAQLGKSKTLAKKVLSRLA